VTLRPARSLVALLLVAAAAPGGCESFDDAVATQGYLDFNGAAAVCARVFTCPGLATSLRRSIAAPIDGVNFSTCMSWLAGPSPTPPAGFAAQGAVLAQVASATTCAAAAAGLGVVPLAANDPLCAQGVTAGCTPGGDLFDCAAGQIVRCPGSQYASGSTCDPIALVCASPGCAAPIDKIGACVSATTLCADDLPPQEEIVCSAFGEGCVADMVPAPGLLDHDLSVSLCTSEDNADPTICGSGQPEGATACTSGGAMVVCDHLRTVPGPLGTSIAFGAVEALYPCQEDLGWPCTAPVTGSMPYCARPGAACSPEDADVNTCDGDVLVACIAGESEQIDCTTVGATCHPAPPGGGAGAFCAFGS
jgi:hypothetical protein